MQKKYYLVCVQLPDDVPVKVMEAYIRTAVQSWKGGMNPAGVLFKMTARQFSVKTVGVVKGKPVITSTTGKVVDLCQPNAGG